MHVLLESVGLGAYAPVFGGKQLIFRIFPSSCAPNPRSSSALSKLFSLYSISLLLHVTVAFFPGLYLTSNFAQSSVSSLPLVTVPAE